MKSFVKLFESWYKERNHSNKYNINWNEIVNYKYFKKLDSLGFQLNIYPDHTTYLEITLFKNQIKIVNEKSPYRHFNESSRIARFICYMKGEINSEFYTDTANLSKKLSDRTDLDFNEENICKSIKECYLTIPDIMKNLDSMGAALDVSSDNYLNQVRVDNEISKQIKDLW